MNRSSKDYREYSLSRGTKCGFEYLKIVSALLTISLLFLLTACDDNRPTIDIGDNATKNISLPDVTSDHRATLRVAVGAMISPEITRRYYQDLMELIAARINRRAIFSQRRTYAETNDLVRKHEVDVALVCSGPYTSGHKEFGMELLVVPLVHGQKFYHSYIIVRHDSPAQSLDDLRGKRFAFTDPHSNTGCLVPTYMLAKQGETPKSFFSETFYTSSHDNSIKAIADGLADGAAVDSLIWEFMNTVDPTETARTKIITRSPPYGIPPIVVHPDLDNDLKQSLKAAFLSILEDKKSIPLLHKIQIDGFAEVDDSVYDSVREMTQWLKTYNKGTSE